IVEPTGVSAEPDPEPLCVPRPELEPEVDLVDAEQFCLPAPSAPEPQVTTETQETQVTTELSTLHNHFLVNIFQLECRMCKCKVLWTPVTEVWPNAVVFLCRETSMVQAKLKEMGITHILNTVAYKEYLQGKIYTRAEYYQEMNITYYGVLVMDEYRFDISKDLFPASEFIHKALSNTEDKLLVHCIDGSVSRSSTLVLAYLMIHHNMMVEDAIDHVTDVRWIGPNMGFLNQLTVHNSDLVRQRKLQPIPKPSCLPGPEEEPQGKTELQNMFQLKQCLEKCALDWTPVTEVWPNVFIGNEETAMDRARLKEMGITHILNTVAVKKKRRVLLGIPRKDDLLGKANIGVKYYKGMNISYYGVPVTDDHLFDISKYFYQAAKFIHKALSNTESKSVGALLRWCQKIFHSCCGISDDHHDMMVEDAMDHVIKVRRIRPNMGFLKQLIILNSKLLNQRKLQFNNRQTDKNHR
uniref:Tyrosine-protein phosphatase domain-containing protein n=1 Tax=Sinocyclocheilus anshuiensis TaxID=1608454 RepID=A0A671K1X5_9TELE